MKEQAKLVRYTIRGIPPEVDRALRRTAAERNQSLNQAIVEALTRAMAGHTRKADFSEFAGQWHRDPGFDEVLAAQRRIDWDKWE